MELDKRINKIAIIYDCFDCKDARTSIGEKGYFSHYYHCFSDLSECRFGVLQDVIDGEHPYDNGKNQYDFFLPERYIINSEKQYRPFTLNEFLHIYELGDIVTFRCKYNEHKFAGIVTGYETDKEGDKAIIHIGCYSYLLSVLFTDYERINSEEGEWVPFGIEVEE